MTVEDVERPKAFYGDVLGLPHLFDAPRTLSFFQCGETRLMLSRLEGGGAGRDSEGNLLGLISG